MKQIKTAIIWRKSVYDNDYVCRCDKKLMENGEVCDDMLYDLEEDELICPDCKWNVAKYTTVEKAYASGAIPSVQA